MTSKSNLIKSQIATASSKVSPRLLSALESIQFARNVRKNISVTVSLRQGHGKLGEFVTRRLPTL